MSERDLTESPKPVSYLASEAYDHLQQAKKSKGIDKTKRIIEARQQYRKEQKEKLDTLPPRARFQMSAMACLEGRNKVYLENPNIRYCPKCWLVERACICDSLKPIQTKHHYIVWLHYKECWRTTNTGTLLPQSCQSSRLLIYGKPEDDAEMDRIFAEEGDRTVILFPTSNSITVCAIENFVHH